MSISSSRLQPQAPVGHLLERGQVLNHFVCDHPMTLPLTFPLLTAATFTIALLAGLYKCIIYPALLSPLARIPAARWHARFSPLYSYYIKYVNIENRTVHDLHTRYGPLVRLGPNELSVNCFEGGLKTIYTGGFPKTEWYHERFTNYETDNLFTTTDPKEHYQLKRMVTNVFSKSSILSSSALRITTSAVIFDRLFPILRESSRSRKAVNIHPLDYAYSMDSFTGFQLGGKLGTNFIQKTEEREWYTHHFFDGRPYLFWDFEVPNFTTWLQRFGIRLVPEWCAESQVALEDWFMPKCDRAAELVASQDEMQLQASGDWPTVFATLKQKYEELDGKSKTPTRAGESQLYPHRLEIASNLFDHTVAAIETSGNALTYLHYELARRPDVQSALRAELLTLDPSRDRKSELPDSKALDALPLLDAVIHETLRRYTPVGGPQPRVTPRVCTIAGYEGIPPVVRVQASSWSLHRNPKVFPDPEAWRPERWIDATPDELTEMRKWFWAFGSGSRMCIGSNFAMLSMKLVVAAVYAHFQTSVVDAEGIEQNDGFSGGPIGNKLWLQFDEI
ncbi:cytochrome p450 monooxygenase [Podospora appendiculata]|uniref:Cytochrome p450 monooxygenase n=1 Tax=Podospora appendiculata TaxID=314037 RepID=A0AAE0XAC2_9PEZI|nr:cytochrome p450 monooxygenase [Podospora appendiculata]